jgi:hypothetical protein
MIPPAMLYTLSFPWKLISSAGEIIDAQDGTLFKLSDLARGHDSSVYCISAPAGWSRCPEGYAVYCRELSFMAGTRLVLHGLKVVGISTISGKSDTLSIRTTADEVERYLATIFAAFLKVESDINNIVRRSVHEVRNINKDIKGITDATFGTLMEKEFYIDDVRTGLLVV